MVGLHIFIIILESHKIDDIFVEYPNTFDCLIKKNKRKKITTSIPMKILQEKKTRNYDYIEIQTKLNETRIVHENPFAYCSLYEWFDANRLASMNTIFQIHHIITMVIQ